MRTKTALVLAAAILTACSGSGSTGQSVTPPVPQNAGAPPVPQSAQPAQTTVAPQTVPTSTPLQQQIQSLSATPAPTPTPLILKSGAVINRDDAFNPADGDAASGGQGQTVDGVPCATTMYTNKYHVHMFVGLIVNKTFYTVPDAVGMYEYGPESSGFTNSAKCYYAIHTHDATGMVHLEANSSASLSSSLYTLGQFLDIWGQTISSSRFGPFYGAVHVYVAKPALRATYSGPFTSYAGDPHAIALYSHEAIWIEVGSSYYTAAELPQIRFYTEY